MTHVTGRARASRNPRAPLQSRWSDGWPESSRVAREDVSSDGASSASAPGESGAPTACSGSVMLEEEEEAAPSHTRQAALGGASNGSSCASSARAPPVPPRAT
eukprot:CAMPEP_0202778902 /NCGR_PEP_ID=MMETSP1388-20130828/55677_1 /ASSEMBLY_ACC=CAM_ASM_000864 /TAXON_ID=37098 /ORGANISM="Isochrysis sp, Strain CCMP1244" /LENGTH=102 /DNA_ID=CAMNT_0049448199 /DNA_START=126 /DNA_END=430 /DNA_ORIENTATION=-